MLEEVEQALLSGWMNRIVTVFGFERLDNLFDVHVWLKY